MEREAPVSGTRVLVVDDEPKLLEVLKPSLEAAGYDVVVAETAVEALRDFAANEFDVVVLDLGLPDMDGKDVIRELRQWSQTPIVVLSARNLSEEKVEVLDIGADDYVNKPFEIRELMARLRVALRRSQRKDLGATSFRAGDLQIDFDRRQVVLGGEPVHLSQREFELLRVLAQNRGQSLTHRRLIAAVWGPQSGADTQWLRVLVSIVRQKIEAEPSSPKVLLTEPGVGYLLRGDEDRPVATT